jgi:hypothetical protein
MQDARICSGMGARNYEQDDELALVDAGWSGERPIVRVRGDLVTQQRSIVHRPCDCCDGELGLVRGVILEEDRPVAVYFATFVVGHERVVRVALGVGGVSALIDLSVDVRGDLVVEAGDELTDIEPLRRFAVAIWKTDELLATYLSAPRTSYIRAISR